MFVQPAIVADMVLHSVRGTQMLDQGMKKAERTPTQQERHRRTLEHEEIELQPSDFWSNGKLKSLHLVEEFNVNVLFFQTNVLSGSVFGACVPPPSGVCACVCLCVGASLCGFPVLFHFRLFGSIPSLDSYCKLFEIL